MKTNTTFLTKTPVKYAPELLKKNGIYLCATNNQEIYVDDLFRTMPCYVQRYILLHEKGHIINKHSHKRDLAQEVEADSYAMEKMGTLLVHKAMLHVMKLFMKIDWTVSAEYLVRLSDLGYTRATKMYIVAPNGVKFDVETLRRFM